MMSKRPPCVKTLGSKVYLNQQRSGVQQQGPLVQRGLSAEG